MHHLSPAPIRIKPGFSLWLALYILLAHFLAIFLVFLLELGMILSIGLVTLILVSLVYHWCMDLLRLGSNSVLSLDWTNSGGWLLMQKCGRKLKAVLCPSSLISQRLVILHFKTSDLGRVRVTIPGDALDSDRLRQLKVLLKMHNHFGV
jgi:hypothetical protein